MPSGYFPFSTGGELKDEYLITSFGMSYEKIRNEFIELRRQSGASVRGFGDMTIEEIASLTGLSRKEAALASKRDFVEPFLFTNGEDPRFFKAAEARGLHWTRGRLYCLMGNHDKGKSVLMLKKWYEREHGKIITIGLGDALNDLPFLKEVDHPVLVQKQDGTYERDINIAGLILAPGAGPAGWNATVLALLTT